MSYDTMSREELLLELTIERTKRETLERYFSELNALLPAAYPPEEIPQYVNRLLNASRIAEQKAVQRASREFDLHAATRVVLEEEQTQLRIVRRQRNKLLQERADIATAMGEESALSTRLLELLKVHYRRPSETTSQPDDVLF